MKNKQWRNQSSLKEKYSLMNIFGKTPMEVADPIATLGYSPEKQNDNQNPEQN